MPPFTGGADDANYPPTQGMWSPTPRGTWDPRARGCRGCAKPQVAQSEQESINCTHSHEARDPAALGRVAGNWALTPQLLLCCAPAQAGGCQQQLKGPLGWGPV